MAAESEYLQLREARQFLSKHGIEFDDRAVEVAAELSKKARGVRKGYLLSVLEDHGLLDTFINEFWPKARSKDGEAVVKRYRLLKEQNEMLVGDTEEENEEDDTSEVLFELEYQLRDFIAHNLNGIRVEGRKLSLYVDSSGRKGIEYPTAVGPIDILAIDDAHNFYAFELKRARSPDHAIGQLARYMGWLQELSQGKRRVYGVIVAKEISDKLRYAVRVVPNVSLFEYEVAFQLNPIAAS